MVIKNICFFTALFLIGSMDCSDKNQNLVNALELAAMLSKQQLPKPLVSPQIKSQRQQIIDHNGAFKTLSDWIQQFEKLLKNRHGAHASKHSGFATCGDKMKQWQEFENVLNAWLLMQSSGPLANSVNWSQSNNGKIKPDIDFFDKSKSCSFAPFAQKLIAQPGDMFYLHGDLHGDIFSLLEELKDLQVKGILDNYFRIIPDNAWLVFLGDYVDRGQYGCEVIYTMMRLALANPDRVIAVRGNHEDIRVSSKYGFKNEINHKFGDADGGKHKIISRMNDFLPVVLYVGCKDVGFRILSATINYIQCCHGGIEEAYKPQLFLDNEITKYQLLGKLSDDHREYGPVLGSVPIGFMWTDFIPGVNVDSNGDRIFVKDGKVFDYERGWAYDENKTGSVLKQDQSSKKSKIHGIMRAHQHSDSVIMKGLVESNGVYKLWRPYEKTLFRKLNDGLVWTFNVGADTVYGERYKFDFDTYAKITTAQKYDQWTMEVFNATVL